MQEKRADRVEDNITGLPAFITLNVCTGNVCCGGCGKNIKRNSDRIQIWRGGRFPKSYHVFCAIKDLKKGERIIIAHFKKNAGRRGNYKFQ